MYVLLLWIWLCGPKLSIYMQRKNSFITFIQGPRVAPQFWRWGEVLMSNFRHPPTALRLKLGKHYPCPRAVFTFMSREHGYQKMTPVFTGRGHGPWTLSVDTGMCVCVQRFNTYRLRCRGIDIGKHWATDSFLLSSATQYTCGTIADRYLPNILMQWSTAHDEWPAPTQTRPFCFSPIAAFYSLPKSKQIGTADSVTVITVLRLLLHVWIFCCMYFHCIPLYSLTHLY